MPTLTKTHHTEVKINSQTYLIPKSKTLDLIKQIKRYRVKDTVSANEVLKDLYKKQGKSGTLIQGLRYRENLSQAELAKAIRVTQGDLSKMENGKRPVGKEIAKRLAALFKSDYRLFL